MYDIRKVRYHSPCSPLSVCLSVGPSDPGWYVWVLFATTRGLPEEQAELEDSGRTGRQRFLQRSGVEVVNVPPPSPPSLHPYTTPEQTTSTLSYIYNHSHFFFLHKVLSLHEGSLTTVYPWVWGSEVDWTGEVCVCTATIGPTELQGINTTP